MSDVAAYWRAQQTQQQVDAYLHAQQAAQVKAYWDAQAAAQAAGRPGSTAPPPTPPPAPPAKGTGADAPVADTPAAPAPPPTPSSDGQSALDQMNAMFPWAKQLGLDDLIKTDGIEGFTTDQILANLRQTAQYKYQTQGMYRADGSLRFSSESQFFTWRDQTKAVLQKFGHLTDGPTTPSDFLGLAESEMLNPSELDTRLQTYDNVVHGSTDTKAAFYVYAGRTLSDDELYKAAVDPGASLALQNEYNQKVALQPLDYDTWITRASQFALTDVVSTLNDLKSKGVDTQDSIDEINKMNPDFAKSIGHALYQSTDQPMALNDFTQAYNAALIGGAARMNGVEMPSEDRVRQFAEAGVTRATALAAYSEIGQHAGGLVGSEQRAGLGNPGTTGLENALLLKGGPDLANLNRGQAEEKAAGLAGGNASLGQNQTTGQLQQKGLGGQQ